MDLVDEDLIYLIHHGIDFFRAKFLGERRETFHVTEHDGYLFSFTFDLVSLGKNLLGNSFGKVFLDLLQFFIRGKFFTGWFGGKNQVMAAVTTEFELGRIQ
ncbi:MAG: hypothetical protein ABSG75_11270 [Syntrophales bacterium]